MIFFQNKTKITLFACFVLLFVGCSFTQHKAAKLLAEAKHKQPYDAIIVPGVPFSNNTWDRTMEGRVCWAFYLYKCGIARNIIFSGGAVYTPYIEAKIMALYAEKLGINKEHIFTETSAEHSTENLYYSYKMAQKLNFRKIALASDPFQTRLLKKFSRRKNLKVDLIPMVLDTLKTFPVANISIDAQPAFAPNFVSLLQRENFWERLKGTRGKKIKYERD